MNNVPKGAITTDKELLFAFLGQTLYLVHGLGPNSFLTEMANVHNLHNIDRFRAFDYTDKDGKYETQCFLGDCNIDAHHNDHYLFSKREDAEAYLEYAKKHTSRRVSRSTVGTIYQLTISS
jgi:hypothetical protein